MPQTTETLPDDPDTLKAMLVAERARNERLIQIIKEEGRAVTAKPVRVGETFDPGPEFAKSSFKYERHNGSIETADPQLMELLQAREYALVAAVPIRNSYFDFSDGVASGQSVSSQNLIGQPNCPHCGAPFGMAVCACGGIHCVDGDGEHLCPWCGKIGSYESAGDGEGFDIGRGRG